MTYPKILCVLIVVVVAIIMGYVIPQFKDLFSQMDALPTSTTILLGYRDLAALAPERIVTIDATQDIDTIHAAIVDNVEKLLATR